MADMRVKHYETCMKNLKYCGFSLWNIYPSNINTEKITFIASSNDLAKSWKLNEPNNEL